MVSLRRSTLTLGLLSAALSAQVTFQRKDGLALGDNFGRAVASVGDLDADGFDDFAVGADLADGNGNDSGAVYVYSGQTRALLFSLQGDSVGDFFGYSVDGAGDVNNDGVPDIVVGAYGDDPPTGLDLGAIYVFSGATQALLYTFVGTNNEDRLGYSVSGAGDVNADGFADVIGGAYTADANGVDSGQAIVWSGRDGSVLWSFAGNGPTQFFGWAVDGAGDVDGDGFSDVIVGSVGDPTGGLLAGTAVVFSGKTGAVLWRFDGQARDLQGAGVAGVGDVDRDGHADLLVGAPFADDGGLDFGAARLYSGRTGALIRSHFPALPFSLFGYPVAAAGDVNGDGSPDLLVTAVLGSGAVPVAGTISVLSGADGSQLALLGGEAIADALGLGAAGACDVDGDGFAEILGGAPFADYSASEAGAAYVFDVNFTGTPPKCVDYGVACVGSNGAAPHVGHIGRPALNETIQFTLRGALPLTNVVMNLGSRTSLALDSFGFTGCTLYASNDGFVVVRNADVDGLVFFDVITVPNNPVFIGQNIAAQWICLDPAANPGGFTFSNGLELTFGN
ncbi:MAG: integrin alpha [Planctomycetota bacterium]